ncbi:MAG: DUF3611 family protein [Coleofasciculaceae cyanobacterium SM2_3_26]|nr:DUF3611 family protein [Coleofasciculaceae cyanobacterium SM2_3_26]
MMRNSDPPALPPAVARVVPAFLWGGRIGLWSQGALAIVSGLIFVLAIPVAIARSTPNAAAANPGTGPGIFFAICGLVMLLFSVYWSFRYVRFSKQLASPIGSDRPKKADALQMLRRGVLSNLIGMGLSLLGAEAITGILFVKALLSPLSQGGLVATDPSRLIQPLDIFVVLANTHTVFAHFIGASISLWLLSAVTRD